MAKSHSLVALACLFVVLASLFASYECSREISSLQEKAQAETSPELGGDGGVGPEIFLGCKVGGTPNGEILWCCKRTGACYSSPRTCNNACYR